MQTTFTSKGQVTVPAKIREQLNLQAGDRLEFEIEDGAIRVTPERKKGTLEDFMNILPKPTRSYTVEEITRQLRFRGLDQSPYRSLLLQLCDLYTHSIRKNEEAKIGRPHPTRNP